MFILGPIPTSKVLASQSSPLCQSARKVSSEGVSVVSTQGLGAPHYEVARTRAPRSSGTVGCPLLAISPDSRLPPTLCSQGSQVPLHPSPWQKYMLSFLQAKKQNRWTRLTALLTSPRWWAH